MGLTRDKIVTVDGKLLFIPSGSGTGGTTTQYAVTMSGASLSASILAPPGETSSFWHFRSTKNYSVKVFYQTTASNAIEPTGSNLYNLVNMRSNTVTGSVVQVHLDAEMTGSSIVKATSVALKADTKVVSRFNISQSYSKPYGGHIFITNRLTGIGPVDEMSVSYITGSTFSYHVLQSGSNSTIGNSDISSSATVQMRLNETEKTRLDTNLQDSASFMNLQDGFYGISMTNATTGSNVSLHGGAPYDFGTKLPNAAYIKTPGSFDILLDNDNSSTTETFRVWTNTGIAGISPGVELLNLDESGNLIVKGTLSGSNLIATVDGGSF